MFHLIARTGMEHSNFVATRKCTMLAKKKDINISKKEIIV